MLYSEFDSIPIQFLDPDITNIGDVRKIIKNHPTDEREINTRLRTIFTFHYMDPIEISSETRTIGRNN